MIERITGFWNDHFEASSSSIVLIGIIALLLDAFFNYLSWYIIKCDMKECGWPNGKPHRIRASITLIPLFSAAPKKGFYMVFCLVLNILNVLSAIVSMVGFFFAIETHVAGWAIIMMSASFLTWSSIQLINFIPNMLFVPSERKRIPVVRWLHGIKKKKK